MRRHRALSILGVLLGVCLIGPVASAIPRTEIVDGAPAFEEHPWTCGPDNLVADCADSSWEPAVTAEGPQVGLPYCWGGWVTPDQFDQQIAQGYGAGSMPEGEFLDCTTGLDCSGYVSQLWQHPYKLGTATIPQASVEIDVTEMQPGDVFNMAGTHVIMFLGEDAGGEAIVTESTNASACMGVCRRSRPWAAMAAYVPRAYVFVDVVSSTQAGTADEPILIEAFPYRDERSTEGAPSDELDVYAAAPDTDESGPERIYVFHVASGGVLDAMVMDAPGVDIDIHLLSALDASACMVRSDGRIMVEVIDPGTYYLVADTYVGDSGTEYTGAYLLTADFDGELAEPVVEPPPEEPPVDAPAEVGEDGCSCGLAGRRGSRQPAGGALLMMAALWMAGRRRRRFSPVVLRI